MRRNSRQWLFPIAAALAMLAGGGLTASADEVIKVTLADKGTDVDMAKGLGFALGGDMSKA